MPTESPSHGPGKRRIRGGWLVLLVPLLLLPILYVLSVGPAARMGGVDRAATLKVVYQPIIWCSLRWPAGRDATLWYCDLWDARIIWHFVMVC